MPNYFYYTAFTYFGNQLYIHGGGSVFGIAMRSSIGRNSLIQADLTCETDESCVYLCSPGTFKTKDGCSLCSEGSYQNKYGKSECIKCSAGSFCPSKGGNTPLQCYPCPQGLFIDREGSSTCRQCPSGKFCPTGSSNALDEDLNDEVISIQPVLFEASSQSAADSRNTALITVCVLGFFILMFVLFISFLRNNLV